MKVSKMWNMTYTAEECEEEDENEEETQRSWKIEDEGGEEWKGMMKVQYVEKTGGRGGKGEENWKTKTWKYERVDNRNSVDL